MSVARVGAHCGLKRFFGKCRGTMANPFGRYNRAMKLIVLLLFFACVYSLGSALFYLNKDRDNSGRLARALTWRIGLSVFLFAFLIFAAWRGWIVPHSVG